MAKENSTRTTRLSGELDERYEDYRDELDMTDAEALRSLIRDGLSVNEGEREGAEKRHTAIEERALSVASTIAAFVICLSVLPILQIAGPSRTATAMGALLVVVVVVVGIVEVRARWREAPPTVDSSAPGVSN